MKQFTRLYLGSAVLLISLFFTDTAYGQYATFWPENRNFSERAFYDEYVRIIDRYNEEKTRVKQ